MNKLNYIKELAESRLSKDGYRYFVSLIKHFVLKYNWPKIILNDNTTSHWNEEDFISFTQQVLLFILEKNKLKNYKNIPDEYLEFYLHSIIVSYVANKIKEYQNKRGLSFDDAKRIALELLKEHYFSKRINSNIFWNKENSFSNPVKNENFINDILKELPKIPLTEKTKHYKPHVKTAIIDIFSLINKPIRQDILLNQIYKLFDQSFFAIDTNEDEKEDEIRETAVYDAINEIINQIKRNDIPIYIDYFFSDSKKSLDFLANKYGSPKSTIHYKINQFRKLIIKTFIPQNEKEGIYFLENLFNQLDELK